MMLQMTWTMTSRVVLMATLAVAMVTAETSSSHQSRSTHILWELRNMPSSSTGDPMSPFHPQSGGRFGDDSVAVVDDPAGEPGKVLRVFYRKGSYSATHSQRGAQFYSRPTGPHTAMTLSYDIYFSPNFHFVKGGKLPGLFGGATNCSGGRHSDACFSTRLMWRSEGAGEVYAYIPEHQEQGLCQQADTHCNPVYGTSLGRGSWKFQTGQWQKVTQRLHLNTPGQLDGMVEVWLDGHRALIVDHLNVRTSPPHGSPPLLIEGIFFSTFFGGSDSSWAPEADCYTYFKNFVIATGSVADIIG